MSGEEVARFFIYQIGRNQRPAYTQAQMIDLFFLILFLTTMYLLCHASSYKMNNSKTKRNAYADSQLLFQ